VSYAKDCASFKRASIVMRPVSCADKIAHNVGSPAPPLSRPQATDAVGGFGSRIVNGLDVTPNQVSTQSTVKIDGED
jgi:hypothetical protein